jgi:hypothetical protein
MRDGSSEIVFIQLSRATMDAIYRELMIAKGFSRWQAWKDWAALRAFGGKAWREHRKKDEEKLQNVLASPTGKAP